MSNFYYYTSLHNPGWIPEPNYLATTDYNSIATLNLQQHATGILDELLDLDEELDCLPAV